MTRILILITILIAVLAFSSSVNSQEGGSVNLHTWETNEKGEAIKKINQSLYNGPFDISPGTGTILTSGKKDKVLSKFEGYIRVPTTGYYLFRSSADDGVELTINNVKLISDWNVHKAHVQNNNPLAYRMFKGKRGFRPKVFTSDKIYLETGKYYPFSLNWFENVGIASLKIEWNKHGENKWEVVNQQYLTDKIPDKYQYLIRFPSSGTWAIKVKQTKVPTKFNILQIKNKENVKTYIAKLFSLQKDTDYYLYVEGDVANIVIAYNNGPFHPISKYLGQATPKPAGKLKPSVEKLKQIDNKIKKTGTITARDKIVLSQIQNMLSTFERNTNIKLNRVKAEQQRISKVFKTIIEKEGQNDKMIDLTKAQGNKQMEGVLAKTHKEMAIHKAQLDLHAKRLKTVETRLIRQNKRLNEINKMLKNIKKV